MEICSAVSNDLDDAVQIIANLHPDILFLREVLKIESASGVFYKIRFNYIKV